MTNPERLPELTPELGERTDTPEIEIVPSTIGIPPGKIGEFVDKNANIPPATEPEPKKGPTYH